MPGEVRLVVESRLDRHLGGRAAIEEQPAGQGDSARDEVLVRGDAEGGTERAHQMGGVGLDQTGRFRQGDAGDHPIVEEFAQAARDAVAGVGAGRRGVPAGEFEAWLEQRAQPFADQGQPALRLECVTG